jgi:hypothetical protein
MSLQDTLLQEYQLHPSFRFDDAPMLLDADAASAFNGAYGRIARYATDLSASAFQQAGQACTQALAAVFEQLRPQSTDEFERRFLEELKLHSGLLLNAEISFIRLSSGGRFGSLADAKALSHADALARECHLFGRLDAATLDGILAIAQPAVAELRAAAVAGARTRDALSMKSGPVVRSICRLLNRDFRAQGLLDAVSAYAGCQMNVSGLALELSIPQSGWWNNCLGDQIKPPRTLYAHLDESIDHPKSIVYLSDVYPEHGPTCVYPQAYQRLAVKPLQELIGRVLNYVGQSEQSPLYSLYARQYHQTMSSEKFRRHFMRLPDAMRFNSHFGWDVLPGGQIEEFLVAREQQMLGPAGTFVVFDGARLLHRGGLMSQGERVALQVIFSDAHLGRKIMRRIKKGNLI